MRTKTLALIAAFALPAHAQEPETQPEPPAPAPAPAPEPPATTAETVPLVLNAHALAQPKPPLFFSAQASTQTTLTAEAWTSETQLTLTTVQGETDLLRVRLTGNGTVTSVTGEGVLAWAVAEQPEDGHTRRFLEIRPTNKDTKTITATVKAEHRDYDVPGEIYPLVFTAGEAIGFTGVHKLSADTSVDVRVVGADGLVPLDTGKAPRQWAFQSFGTGSLKLALSPGGAALAAVEMRDLKLTGNVDAESRSAVFTLTGQAKVNAAEGGAIDILSGHAAVSALPEGGDFGLRLHGGKYQLVFTKAGDYPVEFTFQAGVQNHNGADKLDFSVPPGAVVPLALEGPGDDVRFDPACKVYPKLVDATWLGFLPPSGHCDPVWSAARDEDEGKLFFASGALVETRVGAGLLRQTTTLDLKLLQGKLDGLQVLVEGEGEILSVDGGNVLGWTVAEGEDGNRLLEIQSAQPATGTEQVVVRSQQALGDFPLSAAPMRLTPQGAVRHSGHLRLGNEGAVSLEVGKLSGLTQLAPEQWPGGGGPGARQVFVYRFPSGGYSYQIHADQILPEVSVQQILVYEMTDTDRVIGGRAELDIREAPLREWEITIPADFAVVSVTGAEVADYTVGGEAEGGKRTLKALFKGPTSGRQLVQFRLEKNLAAAAGAWALPPIDYPGAKSLRGFVGAATVPGYRATPAEVENLSEVPMAYFPAKVEGLQQTFRLREGAWSAVLDVAQLPQSVQADVFHLYSLKEGVAYGSVLMNYFVAGAPVGEWLLEVPEGIGNLTVEGQNVQGWGRGEDGKVKVTLHQPAMGAATLLLTFEQPMSARGGTLNPGEVKPIGVAGERGFVQIVSPSQVHHEVAAASPGLLKMEPLELPAEFQVLSNAPSLAVYQYSARPFELAMDIEWFEPGQTIDQLVEFARLESSVSGDGQVVTEAKFYVVTRGRGALRIALPEDSQLWEARVNGQPVNARNDAGQTLVPLPPSLDPNTPVEVSVRLGATSESASRVRIASPKLEAPTMISTWTVKADRDHLLVPSAETAALLSERVLTETGFGWLAAYGTGGLFAALALAVLGAALVRVGGVVRGIGIVALAVSVIMAVALADTAAVERSPNKTTLEFVAPVVGEGDGLTLEFANRDATAAMLNPLGGMAILLGAVLLIAALLAPKLRAFLAAAGAVLVAFGLLAQRGGAIAFFGFLAALVGIALLLPAIIAAARDLSKKDRDKAGTPAPGAVAALLGALLLGAGTHDAGAATPLAPDLIAQEIRVEEGRLYSDVQLRITGEEGDTCLLLRDFATLTGFEGDGLRIAKRDTGFWLVLERAGTFTATASYNRSTAGTPHQFDLPTAKAAVQTIDIRYADAGWEFSSPAAVQVAPLPDLADDESGARLTLGLNGYTKQGNANIAMTPKRRDLATEDAKFYVETANLFIPSPGLVDGRHRVTVRPSRGQLDGLECKVPDGFTVSNVSADALENWRFDPESRALRIDLTPPQSEVFHILVETQHGTGALPTSSKLMPLTIGGAVGSIGTLAVAFGGDAQPETLEPDGLSKVNLDDFDASLIPAVPEGAAPATLHAAYRYGADPGTLDVTAGAVEPEVRVETRQTLSVGDERLVLAVDLNVAITRAGLFSLSFGLPEGLEIEAASGAALSHWTESEQDDGRVVTLHLGGRTLGPQQFALQFAGTSPGDSEAWPVPRLNVREATRQTGQLVVAPEQGIRATAAARTHVSQLDARSVSGGRPGTLAFRLLQADWQLSLGMQSLETWVTASALQEITLRDGLTRTRLGIDYKVENAAVKTLHVRLPGLTPEEEKTVRATGDAVTDMVKVEPTTDDDAEVQEDLWEIRFGRRILGATHLEIEFQRGADRATDANERIHIAELVEASQAAYWVALRVSGHLDVAVEEPGGGWSRVDWGAVPTALQNAGDRSLPAFAYRATAPEAPLALTVQRHAVAQALRLSVSSGELFTVFSAGGDAVTEARLEVEVVEKSTIEVRLPEGAQLMSAGVNGETADIVSVDGAYRFYVLPREKRGAADVSLAWSHPAGGKGKRVALAGPALNLPLEDIRWRVVLPAGYELADADGTLELGGDSEVSEYDFETYRTEVLARRQSQKSDGEQSLQKGIDLRQQGNQEAALEQLGKAIRNSALAPAGKEDAQVQLREIQTERAMLALNTRRQKLFLDNEATSDIKVNDQLKQAAQNNPLFFGSTNYNPSEIDNLFLGNTRSETDALRRVAETMFDQKLAAEPGVRGIDVTAEGRGTVHVFHRSVQVERDEPLRLELHLTRSQGNPFGAGLLALIGAGGIGMLSARRRKA